jgi:hypothetical protein
MNYSLNVSAAFELIVEELTNVIGETDLTGIQAWQSGNYDRAQDIIALVKKLTEFQAKVRGLSADWQKFAADTPIKPADGANMNTPPKVDRNLANGVEVIMRTKGIEASASSALKFRINGVAYTRNFRLDGALEVFTERGIFDC